MDDDQVEKLMARIQATRLSNLEQLMGEKKNAEFAKEFGLDASYISQLRNKHRPFGEKAARKIELFTGLPIGALDTNPELQIEAMSEPGIISLIDSSLEWLSAESKAALLRSISRSM